MGELASLIFYFNVVSRSSVIGSVLGQVGPVANILRVGGLASLIFYFSVVSRTSVIGSVLGQVGPVSLNCEWVI